MGRLIENGGLEFVTGRRSRDPLFSRGWITFYSARVSIRRQSGARGLSADSLGHKTGLDGAVPLRPTLLHRAEFGLCCHVPKLAAERKRPSADSCGLPGGWNLRLWSQKASSWRWENQQTVSAIREAISNRQAAHPL